MRLVPGLPKYRAGRRSGGEGWWGEGQDWHGGMRAKLRGRTTQETNFDGLQVIRGNSVVMLEVGIFYDPRGSTGT